MTEDPTDGLDTDCDGVSDAVYAVTEEYVDELCGGECDRGNRSLLMGIVKRTLCMNMTMRSGTITA